MTREAVFDLACIIRMSYPKTVDPEASISLYQTFQWSVGNDFLPKGYINDFPWIWWRARGDVGDSVVAPCMAAGETCTEGLFSAHGLF